MDRLDEFRVTKVLTSNPESKSSVLLGSIADLPCVIKLRRLALPELELGQALPLRSTHQLDANDVFSWGTGVLNEEGTCYLDIVYPASEAHIAKYTESPKHVVVETSEEYKSKVHEFIQTQRGKQIEWVRGILFEGMESDHVFFRNDDFVLLPNNKWDRKNVDTLYLLALAGPKRAELASIRDLTKDDIPFLLELKAKAAEIVNAQWGLPKSQIKMYFHYHPTYYHLHVHITNITVQEATDFGRCLLLEQVVEMLKLQPMANYDLTFFMQENHQVYKLLQN